MQQVTGAAFSAWQPVPLTRTEIDSPHTRGPYYGMILVADFIGKTPDFRVKNIELNHKNLSAYAGYNSGSLAKLAIINLDIWNPHAGAQRPTQKVTLDLPEHVSTIEVQKLTGPAVDSFDNMTWAGMEWTYENRGVGVKVLNNTETLEVHNKTVEVSIQASEAIVVTFVQ
jgi:Glycosyl hydrolase family 79 C-terminal beta domain